MKKLILAAAVEARVSNILLWLGIAATTMGLSTPGQAACNIRGEHCGRPAWAANAFSNPRDRVPESALEITPYRAAGHSKPERTERIVKKVVPPMKIEKVVQKVAPPVRFADGFGRQFDPTSKVWFDGKSQCWYGKEQFTFKNGGWSYGKKEWAEANGAWKVASGSSPELVSCESVPSFAAKANAIATKTARQSESADKRAASQPAPVTPTPVKIKTVADETAVTAQQPATPAVSAECKKYFPSVGQMISVPCAE